MKTKSKYL